MSSHQRGLWHSYKAETNGPGKATINGYLEDYCFTIEALIDLYQVTFEERWLTEARAFGRPCHPPFPGCKHRRVPLYQRPGSCIGRALPSYTTT
ncbi:MAG: hypothetical protein IPO56_08080 [Flavobacteriales bacterium]|nr:hypothetical protein [Flavobacteriales bacterium]